MNIKYELMYKYICYQEEKERNELLEKIEATDQRLDAESRLFIMNVISRFRKMQEEDHDKTNFFLSFMSYGDRLLSTEDSKCFKGLKCLPGDVLAHATSISHEYGIVGNGYVSDDITYYNFSVNLLEEKKTKQGHVQTLTKRKKN